MKKTITLFALILIVSSMSAQPTLKSTDLHTGYHFNQYSLSNLNTANLMPSGANVTWDLNSTTATLIGTVDFLEMSETPYQAEYPAANFAMKFKLIGEVPNYSLFKLSNTVFEEVANNVGTLTSFSFLNYRTVLVFPFAFNSVITDIYQKQNQEVKTIKHTYDAYGSFLANDTTNSKIVRIYTDDNDQIAPVWWNSSPFVPLFRASSEGFILWQLTTTTTGIQEANNNQLFEIYPNPATNELHILNKELISRIEIYNTVGQLQFSTTQSIIDISGLKIGQYIVKAYLAKGAVSQNFVKK